MLLQRTLKASVESHPALCRWSAATLLVWLRARQNAGLSQADIAARMGTKAPAITRLESSLTSGRHSPSIATLKKYAEAVNCHLEIKLVH